MKKLIYCALALATGLFATSCQQENLEPAQSGSTVTFKVEIPEVATKANPVGNNAGMIDDLVYAVYTTTASSVEKALENWEETTHQIYAVNSPAENKRFADGTDVISLELLNDQNHIVLLWAQHNDTWVDEHGSEINLTSISYPDNMTVTAEEDADKYAAFSAVKYIAANYKANSETINLTRPFAQINLGTMDPKNFDVAITGTTLTVRNAGDAFNVAAERAQDNADVTYTWPRKVSDNPLTVNAQDYDHYLAMSYVFVKDNVTVDYEINAGYHGVIDYTINEVPVAKNFRTNIIGNLLTGDVTYNVSLDKEWGAPEPSEIFIVKTDEELAAALQSKAEVIKIILAADLNLNAQDAHLKLGTDKTKKIVFEGQTINTRSNEAAYFTLNLATSYWSRLNTVNPKAWIVMKNLNLTSSQESGTWNSYDVTFKCNVELENVNILKALALDGESKKAVLKNVSISESHDYYALWIVPTDMNVEWNDGVVNCPNGRGIKIDDQYVENPTPTTLKVSNVVFNTAKKAAIVAKSAAEVSIVAENIDITNTADPINEVWVASDAPEGSFEKVSVNTGTDKVLEGSDDVPVVVSTPEELQAAINAADKGNNLIYFKDVIISDSNITVLQKLGVNIIIDGNDKEFDGTFILQGGSQGNSTETLTFKNINFKHEETGTFYFIDANSAEVGERYVHNVTVDNCTFTGSADAVALRFRQAYNLTVSNTSVVSGHSLLQAYGTTGIVIDNVEVEAGRGVSLGSSTGVEIKDSEFTVNSYGVRGNDSGNDKSADVKIDNSTISAAQPVVVRYLNNADCTYTVTLSGATLNPTTEGDYQVIFTKGKDDAEYVKPTGKYALNILDDKTYKQFPEAFPVATWDEFTAALAAGEDWIKLTADITYDKSYTISKNATIDLNGKTLEISDPSSRLNLGDKNTNTKVNVTIKNGGLKCKVYTQKGEAALLDIKFGGTIAYTSDAQGVITVGSSNLLAERCDMSQVKANAAATRPRALSTEGLSSGYLRLIDCNFPSGSDGTGSWVATKLLRTYINPLSGNATLEITKCKFGVACNIDLSASYVWSNMNLTGCSGGFTFTVSRSKDSLTEEETGIMNAIKKNNSGTIKAYYNGTLVEY